MRRLFFISLLLLAPLAQGETASNAFGVGHSVIRGMTRFTNNGTFLYGDLVATGRYWDGTRYMGFLGKYNYSVQRPYLSWAGNAQNLNGKLVFDPSGAGLETTCMSVVEVGYDGGVIAACRSRKSTLEYDGYLVKTDTNGYLDSAFGTGGFAESGLQTSGNAVLPRTIRYYGSYAGTVAGVVVVGGTIGSYSTGVWHPYLALYDLATGELKNSVTLTGVNGSAMDVVTDGVVMYLLVTPSSAPYSVRVYRYNSSLVSAGGNWGSVISLTSGGGGGESLPSSMYLEGSQIYIAGSDRVTSTPPWRCFVAVVNTSTGLLDTTYGKNSLPSGTESATGVYLYSHDVGGTRDCILNAVNKYGGSSELHLAGTAYNGSNYDFLTTNIDISSPTNPGYTVSTQAGGSKDDVFTSVDYEDAGYQYILAGRQSGAVYDKLVVSYNNGDGSFISSPSANSWVNSAPVGTPITARRNATATSTDNSVFIYGGWNGTSTYYGDGAWFDGISNAWNPIDLTGAPSGRYGHTAVFTGTQVIVFGGRDGSSYFNDGGVYDVVNGTWSAIGTGGDGPPTGRAFHTAVWTGTKMIVWGGTDGVSSQYDGGMYDPATGEWTITDVGGSVPTDRYNHSAVWTGTQMILFGGYTDNSGIGPGELGDGAIFDPNNGLNGSWSAMNSTNAPSARQKQFSCWTGLYAIIYGGENSGSYTSGIKGYNPVTDTWLSGSTTNEPSAREFAAAWTDADLIVWGGRTGVSSYANTGFKYSLSANSWTAMTTTNAPTARANHSAAWTGKTLMIFGGHGASNTNTTGIYYP